MAFPEDTEYPTTGAKAVRRPRVTELASSSLFALLLQIGLGVLALVYAVVDEVGFALYGSFYISYVVTLISYYGFLIVWTLLSITAVLQLHAGYKLYKMIPDTISRAMWIDVIVIILFGIDVVISAYEDILMTYPQSLIYLAANVLLVYLLNLQSVRNELGPGDRPQSEYES